MKYNLNSVSINNDSEVEILGTLIAHNTSDQMIKRVVKGQSLATSDGFQIYFYGGHSDEEIQPGEPYSEEILLSAPIAAFGSAGEVKLDFRLTMLETQSVNTFELDPIDVSKGISKHQLSGLLGGEATANICAWKLEGPKTTKFEFVVHVHSSQFIHDHQIKLNVDLLDSSGITIANSSPVQNVDPFGSADYSSLFYDIKNKAAKNAKLLFTITTFKQNQNLGGSIESRVSLPVK